MTSNSSERDKPMQTVTIFAWVGTILVNIAFLSLIAWGTSKLWPLGFALSALYTCGLFALARYLYNKYSADSLRSTSFVEEDVTLSGDAVASSDNASFQSVSADRPSETGEKTSRTGVVESPPPVPLLITLLYGLAVIAFGVTGFFIPINVLSCDNYSSTYDTNNWTSEDVPTAVATQLESGPDPTPEFVFVPATGSTFFVSDADDSLWQVNSTEKPRHYSKFNSIEQLLLTSDDTFCGFSGTNGFFCMNDKTQKTQHLQIMDYVMTESLFSLDKTLWFKTYPENSNGYKVYSIDTSDLSARLVPVLHSTQTSESGSTAGCDFRQSVRKQAIVSLFLTGLPISLSSVLIWCRRHVPSMAPTAFAGFTIIFTCLCFSINPSLDVMALPFKLWYSLASAAWLVVLTRLLLLHHSVRKPPLRWGINFGGATFFFGILMLCRVFAADRLLNWALVTIFGFVPLIVIGIGTECGLPLALGAIGFMLDVGRLGWYVESLFPSDVKYLPSFVVFAVGGIIVGGAGYVLSKYRLKIREVLGFRTDETIAFTEQDSEVETPVLNIESSSDAKVSTFKTLGDEEEIMVTAQPVPVTAQDVPVEKSKYGNIDPDVEELGMEA